MSGVLEMTVGRLLTQNRQRPREAQANLDYLASLPRKSAFRIHSTQVFEPVRQGIGWYYRGIIRYEPKEYMSDERIEKGRIEIVDRVRTACTHARWGMLPWHIEGNVSPHQQAIITGPPKAPTVRLAPQEPIDVVGPIPLDKAPRDRTVSRPGEKAIKKVTDKLDLISEPSRLRILLLLEQRERNVTELCDDLATQSQPAVSHQLSLLRRGGLVDTRRVGQHVYYSLTDEGRELVDFAKRLIA